MEKKSKNYLIDADGVDMNSALIIIYQKIMIVKNILTMKRNLIHDIAAIVVRTYTDFHSGAIGAARYYVMIVGCQRIIPVKGYLRLKLRGASRKKRSHSIIIGINSGGILH